MVSRYQIRLPFRLFCYFFLEAFPFIVLALLVLTALILAQQIARQSEILFSSTASLLLSLQVIFSLLPGVMVITLPFSLLIGSLMALNRLSSDSEIIAAQASGLGIFRLSLPLVLCGLLGVAISLYLTIMVIPQILTSAKLVRNNLLLRALANPIKPQTFNTYFPNHLIYIKEIDKETGAWQGVFIVRKTSEANQVVLTARQARLRMTQTTPIVLELDLEDGVLVTMAAALPERQSLINFTHQEIRLASDSSVLAQSIEKARALQELPLDQLRENGKYAKTLAERRQAQVEWHKRFALPIACLILVIVAIPLGTKTTRQTGRVVAFTLGFTLAIGYYLILLAGQSFALSGALPAALGIWLPNILGMVGCFYLYFSPRGSFTFTKKIVSGRSPLHQSPPQKTATNQSITRHTPLPSNRLKRYHLSFSGLIDYLLLSELVKYLFLASTILVLTSLVFTLFELVPALARSNLGWGYAAIYLSYLAPQILYYITPFALLLAVLIAHGTLARSNQIVALLIGGQSYARLATPLILCSILSIAALFALSEQVLPVANREQDARYNHIKGKKLEQSVIALGRQWVQGEDGTIYGYQYNAPVNILLNTTAYHLNKSSGVLSEIVQANTTLPQSKQSWQIVNGWTLRFNEEKEQAGVKFQSITPDSPAQLLVPDSNIIFNRVTNEATKMSFLELRQYIYYLSKLNAPTTSLRVELEKKIAFPFSCLPLLVMAFPLALNNSRRGTLAGIGLSITIGFTYWISASLFESLGRQAFLPPGLSVWGPQALFTSLGIFLAFRRRR